MSAKWSSQPAPPWTNQDLLLYHGTGVEYGALILSEGVSLIPQQEKTDFGKGFYTTTDYEQADAFAEKRFGSRRSVLKFAVNRNRLASLEMLAFVQSATQAADYWSFVQHCRNVGSGHLRQIVPPREYDIVIGPVAKNWDARVAYIDYDQVSFHTNKAIALLNANGKRWRVS